VLRVLLRADDPVRRQRLAAMVEAVGHLVVSDTPDVVLCDLARDAAPPAEAEAPVVVLIRRLLLTVTPVASGICSTPTRTSLSPSAPPMLSPTVTEPPLPSASTRVGLLKRNVPSLTTTVETVPGRDTFGAKPPNSSVPRPYFVRVWLLNWI